jgi:glycyl-tRNA synthetase
MFKTFAGPVEDAARRLDAPRDRPGDVRRLHDVQRTSRQKVPFGIAQMGKSFRNEITPATSCSARASSSRWRWSSSSSPAPTRSGTSTGSTSGSTGTSISASGARTCGCASTGPTRCPTTRSAPSTSSTTSRTRRWAGRSSRASPTAPTSTSRRTRRVSGQDLTYYDQVADKRYHPYVIEPAAGATRATLAFLYDAYRVEQAPDAKGSSRSGSSCGSTSGWRPTRSRCCPCPRRTPSPRRPRRCSTS